MYLTGSRRVEELMRVVFIVSALNRSGTNFLSDVICMNEKYYAVPGVDEDYLLRYSDHILAYVQRTLPHWSRPFRDTSHPAHSEILSGFGDLMLSTIERMAPRTNGVLVLKTPRPEGIRNVRYLFPDSRILIVDRDGRDVVDSFLRSFNGYNFTGAVQLWRDGVRELEAACSDFSDSEKAQQFLRVKYENVFSGDSQTLLSLNSFFGFDEGTITPESIGALPLRGSSVVRSGDGSLSWDEIPRPNAYDPRGKWRKWSWYKRRKFKFIAGDELRKLGYC